jgi:4-amino-4-deoxy-L-arabinose transferase-like glycosyltransferase
MRESDLKQKDSAHILLLVTTLVSVVIVIYVRIRLLGIPLERDEGEYAYAGQLILQGIPPYILAYSMKLPGIHAAYALIMAIFGESSRGIHMGLLLVNLATIALMFFLVRRLFDKAAAAAAASVYAMLSLSPTVLGVFAHATHFVVLPAVAGALSLLRAFEKGKNVHFFLPGMYFGLAFVMKQHGIFFVLLGAAWLVLELLHQGAGAKRLAKSGGWYTLGAVLPFAIIAAVLAAAGVFQNFLFWTFEYARTYASEMPLQNGFLLFIRMLTRVTGATLPIWVFALIGLTTPLWDDKGRERKGIIFLFFVFSFVAICPGFYFREHYFVLMLPVVALLAGGAVSAAIRRQKDGGIAGTLAKVSVYIFIASIIFPVVVYGEQYFRTTPARLSREIYGPNPFPEAVEIASRIRASSGPNDTVAILGSEPEILFYSNRRSATGHIYMYGLMEPQPYASRMQMETAREIEAARPKHIVVVNIPTSWLVRPGSDRFIFQWLDQYVKAHYNRVGVADITSMVETSYIWGKAAVNYRPRSPYFIFLFERNDEPRVHGDLKNPNF